MAQREIYVPAPAVRSATGRKTRRKRPEPPPSPTVRAGRIFRGFAWDGRHASAYSPPPQLGSLATMTVRSAIARTSWTGESIEVATREQAARTVEAVMAAFGFDLEE